VVTRKAVSSWFQADNTSLKGSGAVVVSGLRILLMGLKADTVRRLRALEGAGHQLHTLSAREFSAQGCGHCPRPDVVILGPRLRAGWVHQLVSRFFEQTRPGGKRPFLIALTDPGEFPGLSLESGPHVDLFLGRSLELRSLQQVLRRFQAVCLLEEPA
jgi:hypothetical protein